MNFHYSISIKLREFRNISTLHFLQSGIIRNILEAFRHNLDTMETGISAASFWNEAKAHQFAAEKI